MKKTLTIFLIFIVWIMILFGFCSRIILTKEERAKDQLAYRSIKVKRNQLFAPLEFEGEIFYKYGAHCGSGRVFCLKIMFSRMDSINWRNGYQVVDYGSIGLFHPDSNLIILNTRFYWKEYGNMRSIKMPVEVGDWIKKERGDTTFTVMSKKYGKKFQIKPAWQIEGDGIDQQFWEKEFFRYQPIDSDSIKEKR